MTVAYGDDKLVKGAEVRELYEDAGWTLLLGRDAAEIEDSIRHTAVYLTARDGARLVGIAAALTDRIHYAHVTEFLVRRSHQERGVDSELVRRMLEALSREQVITIFAEPDAEAFYRRFGFAPTAGGMILRRS